MQNVKPRHGSPTVFLALTFLLSALLYLLNALANNEVLGSRELVPFYIALLTFTPVLAASLISYRRGGRDELKTLLLRVIDLKRTAQKRWWVIALSLGPLIFLVSLGCMAVFDVPTLPAMVPVAVLPLALGFAVLLAAGEETGWMPYAAEPLQARYGALPAALMLGGVWALWHVPFFVFLFPDPIALGARLLTLVGARVILVWVYNNAGKSVFAAVLYHAADNTALMVLPDIKSAAPLGSVVHCGLTLLVALAIAVLWEPKTLARLKGRAS